MRTGLTLGRVPYARISNPATERGCRVDVRRTDSAQRASGRPHSGAMLEAEERLERGASFMHARADDHGGIRGEVGRRGRTDRYTRETPARPSRRIPRGWACSLCRYGVTFVCTYTRLRSVSPRLWVLRFQMELGVVKLWLRPKRRCERETVNGFREQPRLSKMALAATQYTA